MDVSRTGRIVRGVLVGAVIHTGAVLGALALRHWLLRECLPDECEPPHYFGANSFYLVALFVAYPLGCVALVVAASRSFAQEEPRFRAALAASFCVSIATVLVVTLLAMWPSGFSPMQWQALVIGAPAVAAACAVGWVGLAVRSGRFSLVEEPGRR